MASTDGDKSKTSTSANESPGASNSTEQPAALPQLSALEDDDEFEEFNAEDWEDDDNNPASTEHLWQDNWDEDEVAEEFANQLRSALSSSGTQAMET